MRHFSIRKWRNYLRRHPSPFSRKKKWTSWQLSSSPRWLPLSRINAQSADTLKRPTGYSPMVPWPALRLALKSRRTTSGRKSMKPTSQSRFSLLARNGSDGRRLCTICGRLTEPADIWADGTHTCSKACSEVKRYNISILEKGVFAGKPYRSQAHAWLLRRMNLSGLSWYQQI